MSFTRFFVSKMSTILEKKVIGLLTLAMLGTFLGPTAHAASCDPVIEGQYGRGSDAAVYSSCTTTVSRVEHTVAIKYNPGGGFIDTVVDLPSAFTPDAPASTASIGTLANFYSQDMGAGYIGDCRTMKGKLNATPTAVSGNFFCFRFEGSSADLYLGAYYNSLFDSLSRGTATIVFPPTADDFVTTWKTDNPGTSSSTSITVPIFGGPYDVDWDNDGTFDELGINDPVTHDFVIAGTYTIRVRGSYNRIQFANGGDKEKIISLDQWGTNTWTSTAQAYFGAVNLTVPATDTPDFSAVGSMVGMFNTATLANPDTSGWNTAGVKNMSYMFAGATSAEPNTSGWNTAAVKDMSSMFAGATSANPDTSNWDTSAVEDMSHMFSNATSADPNTSNWVTSAVKSMSGMFFRATLADPNTSSWDTSSVTNMYQMFMGTSLANPDTSSWNTSLLTNTSHMFYSATSFDRDIGSWNVTSLTDATNMFYQITLSLANYESLLLGWDTQVLKPGVKFHGGNSVYCSDPAIAARDNMIASDGWVITDGGQSCSVVGEIMFSDGFE